MLRSCEIVLAAMDWRLEAGGWRVARWAARPTQRCRGVHASVCGKGR